MTSETGSGSDLAEDRCAVALRALETAVETPVVPGELAPWLATVRSALERVAAELPRTLEAQRAARAQIEEEDVALIEAVRDLERAEGELTAQLGELRARVTAVEAAASAAGPDEARFATEVAAVTELGLATVVGLRRQAIATRTWLTEALVRERGVAD